MESVCGIEQGSGGDHAVDARNGGAVWSAQSVSGGRPVTVEVPSLCDGEVEIDAEGRIFLVQPFTQTNGQFVERLIFMGQVTKTGEVFTDRDEKGSPVVLERVR